MRPAPQPGRSDRPDAGQALTSSNTASQDSTDCGVFYSVTPHSANGQPSLTVVENVRCLDCGTVYAKPAGGGTVRQNPGCPDCGYVGWIGLDEPIMEPWPPSRSAADPLRRHGG
jgi:hypothetical protein